MVGLAWLSVNSIKGKSALRIDRVNLLPVKSELNELRL
jgi:hypothetical protein